MSDITAITAGTTGASNVATATDSTAATDSRRYTKFDHSATDAGETNFSFDDFLDMVNPLQHIPVVSSIYRAIEGENINPISRVAGDMMYGGILGVVSAVIGGLGAVANIVVEQQTGQDVAGNIVAALFGPSDPSTAETQVADTTSDPATTAATTQTAATATPAAIVGSPVPTTPPAATTVPAATPTPAAAPTTLPAAVTGTIPLAAASTAAPTNTINGAKAFPLDRTKQAYGGVMDMGNAMTAQNMAIALSEGSHSMRLGHTIYTSRLMNGPHPLPIAQQPVATATPSAASTAPATTTTASAASTTTATTIADDSTAASPAPADVAGMQRSPLPQSPVSDMLILKALGQYKGVAAGAMSTSGSTVNTMN